MNKLVPFRSVVIFGGAGFIGSNWAYRLLKTSDAKIHIFDNLSRRGVHQNLSWLQREAAGSERLKITIGDIRDAALVERAVSQATEVYQFAAQVAVTTSVDDPRTDFEMNVGGTLNVLEAARKSKRNPLVLFTSTNKVYGKLGSRPAVPNCRRYICDAQVCVNRIAAAGLLFAVRLLQGSGRPIRARLSPHVWPAHRGVPDVVHCRGAAVWHRRPGMGGALSVFRHGRPAGHDLR